MHKRGQAISWLVSPAAWLIRQVQQFWVRACRQFDPAHCSASVAGSLFCWCARITVVLLVVRWCAVVLLVVRWCAVVLLVVRWCAVVLLVCPDHCCSASGPLVCCCSAGVPSALFCWCARLIWLVQRWSKVCSTLLFRPPVALWGQSPVALLVSPPWVGSLFPTPCVRHLWPFRSTRGKPKYLALTPAGCAVPE